VKGSGLPSRQDLAEFWDPRMDFAARQHLQTNPFMVHTKCYTRQHVGSKIASTHPEKAQAPDV